MDGQQQLKGQVNVRTKGRGSRRGKTWVVEISTVDFPNLPGGRSLPPETCLFWEKTGLGIRNSTVVETYADWDAAREGHRKWLESPRAVAQAMVEAGWRG